MEESEAGERKPIPKDRFPWKKWTATYTVALLIGLYTVFVTEQYWNWLAMPVLHVPRMTFLQALCAMIMVGLFTRSGFPFKFTKGDVGYLKSVEFALELCIPPEKMDEWKAHSNDQALILFEAFGAIFGAIAIDTLLLALGFALHLAVAA